MKQVFSSPLLFYFRFKHWALSLAGSIRKVDLYKFSCSTEFGHKKEVILWTLLLSRLCREALGSISLSFYTWITLHLDATRLVVWLFPTRQTGTGTTTTKSFKWFNNWRTSFKKRMICILRCVMVSRRSYDIREISDKLFLAWSTFVCQIELISLR